MKKTIEETIKEIKDSSFKREVERGKIEFSNWYREKHDIHLMATLDYQLLEFRPKKIVELTSHDNFNLEDDYFYFECGEKIVSLNEEEIQNRFEKMIEEESEELKEFEDYYIKKMQQREQ